MAGKGVTKLLTDWEMSLAETRLLNRSLPITGNSKRKSKILTDEDAAAFEKKMVDRNYAQAVARDWEKL